MNLFLKIFRLLPPEIAHKIALDLLNLFHKFGILSFIFKKPKDENCSFAGMNLSNRLGTAAGLDKNGDYIDCLGALGFGFLEVGTVTPLPQYGNPKPRVFRNFDENSIINRLGFNNKGVDRLVKNLKSRSFEGIVGVNVGANKNSNDEERINDYLHCIEKVYKYADYITVNVSSPNTPNLRNLQNDANLLNLVSKVDKMVNKLQIRIPLFLKISPDENNTTIENIVEIIKNSIFSGIVATNTTIDKTSLLNIKYKNIEGGLSGGPLMNKSTEMIKMINTKANKTIPIIGVGGVMDKEDYLEKITSGAGLVQIYTGFVIKGPNIVSQILSN
ncbi:quinone-dependent dihydroorotate dehydrogenase [Gammaproteobacteria bacterium]|nr:quinone-dependent dihydroorotate dehydrogenase [Gammaproteobacteria bacterium]